MNKPDVIRLLNFTTLYPNIEQPTHGIFVETRLRHLLASGQATARVVAPVPYYPLIGRFRAGYPNRASLPFAESRKDIDIVHPRYPLVPKLSAWAAPLLMLNPARRAVELVRRSGFEFDLIDAHYFFPDGVTAAILGKRLGVPVVITARGTDVNLIADHPVPRRMITWAAERAAAVIAVAGALKARLTEIGVPADKVRVIRNGVDLSLFTPQDRDSARRGLGVAGTMLLSVGHLIPRKGHDIAIGALRHLPEVGLLIVGDGPEEAALRRLAGASGVGARVRFLGRLPHESLCRVYSAADILILASSREGWPNVLLESMACGTPVVAAGVWGTPEVVTAPEAGELFDERTPEAAAAAVRRLLQRGVDRQATRAYAERYGWEETSRSQLKLFRDVLGGRLRSAALDDASAR